jgi:hypothetical protein
MTDRRCVQRCADTLHDVPKGISAGSNEMYAFEWRNCIRNDFESASRPHGTGMRICHCTTAQYSTA